MSLGTFAVLGLPDGMLGTAWPAMRHSFGVPVGDLGIILLINTIGSVAACPRQPPGWPPSATGVR